ncbi:MAG: hypothetical protein ACI9XP_001344 [Lentimonas sp.]|jgi:hypothetical protein
MVKLYSIFSFLFCFGSLFSQTYGNEWIDYNQTYYNLKIWQSGLYKITYTDLENSNIPVQNFTSSNIQIFGREKEIPLHIVDGGDNQLDPGDYILFFGLRNDGWLDSGLYKVPEEIGNPDYSLYNDTINYFFTWNGLSTNLRYSIETDIDFASYTPADYIWWKTKTERHNLYYEGKNLSNLSSSLFNNGEGYASGSFGSGSVFTFNASTSQKFIGANSPPSSFEGKSFSTNNAAVGTQSGYNHHLRYKMGTQDTLLFDTLYRGVDNIYFKTSFPTGSLNGNTTAIRWMIINDLGVSDNQGFSYMALNYPRTPNLSGVSLGDFLVPDALNQSKIRLDIASWSTVNPVLLVEGGTQPRLIIPTQNGVIRQALIPNSGQNKDQMVRFQSLSQTLAIPSGLTKVTASGKFTDYSLNPVDSSLIIIYNKKLEAGRNDYKAYRESSAGGAHHVITAEVDELYMQFGGGIPKHINGIRQFTKFLYDPALRKPAGLLLLGKAIREASIYSFPFASEGSRTNADFYAKNLVPSFGQPSSDNAITASWVPGNWTPFIATGRISVNTNTELNNYLEKVIAFEIQQQQNSVYDSPNKDWQKQIIHFGGGSTLAEQAEFRYYLEEMEDKIEKDFFGGNVYRVYKKNSDPLDPTVYSEVSEKLSTGTSILNFFGHANSQSSGFEINIDEPQNWNNKGRYPIVIANTCYNGNIFYHENISVSTSERFVRANGAGAIAFLSTVYLGFPDALFRFTNELYAQFSNKGYGLTLGEQIKRTINTLENSTNNDIVIESTALQMALNGDPLIKLNWHENPEIELLPEYVSFGPDDIDLTVDSIILNIELKNLGKSIVDTFLLEIVRKFPQSNQDSTYIKLIPNLHYTRNVQVKIPLQANIGIGLNEFTISADIPSFIQENYEEFANNQIKRIFFIDIDGVIPISPSKFAVIPEDTISLIASTINPIAGTDTYFFEVDTTDLFNSPFKRVQAITASGGVIQANHLDWTLASTSQNSPLICTDSTVYFWRVAIQDTALIWKESSFQYIQTKSGWGQDHFFQFKDNDYSQIDYNRSQRKKSFTTADTTYLDCYVYGSNVATSANQWQINGQQQDYDLCFFRPQIQVGVVDPLTMTSWGTHFNGQNPDHIFGNYNENGVCRQRVEKWFLFTQNNATELASFQNMVLNEVPDGHYIIIYAPYFGARYDLWNSTDSLGMYSTFAALGSDSINAGRINAPMAFFVQKGSPETVIELFGENSNDPVHLIGPIVGYDFLGQETAPLIGPAKKWNNFYWKSDKLESGNDTTVLHIDTYNSQKKYQYTTQFNLQPEDSITNLGTFFDVQDSPFMSLRSIYTDSVTSTPSQLDRWHVLYEQLPDAAIDGKNLLWSATGIDTLDEGEEITFAVDVKNVLGIDMDSLLVHYFIEDKNHIRHYLNVDRGDSLRAGGTHRDTIKFSTVGFPNENTFWMEVNPLKPNSTDFDQPEQYHFNNLLQIPFNVREDRINPILDVTFEGRHILNGDIVNPKSEILITLKDENQYLIMDDVSDTSFFGVYLTPPSGQQQRIYFESNGKTNMQWIPADESNRKFKIVFPTDLKTNGMYTLLVQGSDKSGNLSGDFEYRISFEVIRESTITYLMNYPNPFSTSTRFVFTLTGSEIPDDMIIQIMTVSGRVVREITESEFGPIYIGRNISEYAWDGRDEFGDPLANGVYLYNVRIKVRGEDIEHRNSGADSHFTKEFGKMYLMR